MAAALARAAKHLIAKPTLNITRIPHFLASSYFSSRSISPPLPGFITLPARNLFRNYYIQQNFESCASLLNTKRWISSESGDAFPVVEMEKYIPGCDLKHWLIFVKEPGGRNASKEKMVNSYVETLTQVLESKDPKEARERIYSVSCKGYFAFGCKIDEDTSNKLIEYEDVIAVIPDSYVDVENKDYGGELFENGEIVERSPERQRRVQPDPST